MSVAITANAANYLSCNGTSFGGLQNASAQTFCAWIKPSSNSISREIFSIGATTSSDIFSARAKSDATIRGLFSGGETATLGSFSANNWYFVAISKAATNLSGNAGFAAEGAGSFSYAVTGQGTSTSTNSLAYFILGGTTWGPSGVFGGEICCARFWNAQLSAEELYQEMTHSAAQKATGLIADWRLSTNSDLTSGSYSLTKVGTVTTGATEPTDIASVASVAPIAAYYQNMRSND